MINTVTFKSSPDFYRKEYLGLKPNTVRRQDERSDYRFDLLTKFIAGKINHLQIQIINTETEESFVRDVVDVSIYGELWIISWRNQ